MRRRNRNATDEDHTHPANKDVPDLWRINPWLTSHMIGAAHGQRIDTAEQERGQAMFAALDKQSAATIADVGQELKNEKDERQGRTAALVDWAQEGGSTAASATPENIKAASD